MTIKEERKRVKHYIISQPKHYIMPTKQGIYVKKSCYKSSMMLPIKDGQRNNDGKKNDRAITDRYYYHQRIIIIQQ